MVAEEDIAEAVAALRRGELVAFPTETVYGLGADARDPAALRRLFAAKGRPTDHPVIVHLASEEELGLWASPVPPEAERLAEAFWPGPLTLVLPRAAGVPDLVTGGQETIGVRVPNHPVALALLRAFGGGVAAPSANRFGRLSPTRAEHVRAELGEAVSVVLDGGPTDVGVESTVLDLTGDRPALLRPGGISPAQIAAVIGTTPQTGRRDAPRASGTLPSHYAPATPLELVPPEDLEARARYLAAGGTPVAVLARRPTPERLVGDGNLRWRAAPREAEGYARGLYAALRELDEGGAGRILVEEAPEGEEWLAVRDRLRRAARGGGGR